MQEQKLELTIKQSQKLSPKMLQSTRILQMDTQELGEFINRALEENPVLERAPEEEMRREWDRLRAQSRWLDMPRRAEETDRASEQGAWDRESGSAEAFLRDQLERLPLEKEELALCRYLVDMLTPEGYLEQEDLGNLENLGISETLVAGAVTTLQSLEPAGIAARNLQECLQLQLERESGDCTLEKKIVAEHLQDLGKGRWQAIGAALGISPGEVQRAAEHIRSLNPKPASGDEIRQQPEYIVPDVYIVEQDGELQVVLNEYYVPRICVGGYYARLMAQKPDEDVRTFLKKRMEGASFVIDCLERRKKTLTGCAELILREQREFFEGKSGHLKPMTQKQAADMLALHESTIGRCLRGKYLQCRRGTYPLQYFFSHPVDAKGDVSEQALRRELMELLAGEDRKKPLSDQQLCEQLARKGIPLARRTVTKYRQKMNIPPAYGRRNWNAEE